MNPRLKRYGILYYVAFVLALIVALHYLALPKISHRIVQRPPHEQALPIRFPHLQPDFYKPSGLENSPGTYVYSFSLNYRPWQQSKFTLNPVGCIEEITINRRIIPIRALPVCGMTPGLTIDFGPHLQPGDNLFTVRVSNKRNFRSSRGYDTATFGLHMGPKLQNLQNMKLADGLALLLLAALSAGLVFFMKRHTGEIGSGLILSAGLVAYLRHFSVTNFMQYTIDMPSHLQYIAFIANRGFWPKPYQGWEYYHPALYYHLEAMVIWVANWLGSFDSISMMRSFSLACFMVFLIFSALTLHRLIQSRSVYYVALILLVFYPTGIIFATRLDSHLLYYSFHAACIFFLLAWLQDKRRKYLWISLAMAGLAIGTRSNALVLAPLIGLAVLYQWRRGDFRVADIFSKGMLASLCVIALGMTANFGRTAYYHLTENNTMPYIVGNIASIQRSQSVVTSIDHMFLLDTQQLFSPPFLNWWHDFTGRQYFWNALLKTSLFEHFTWDAVQYAKLLLFLLLALILYIVVGVCTQTIRKRVEWRMCAIALLVPIAMLMVNRVLHPYAPSQDFRYIYPALVSFCAMLGLIIEQYNARGRYTAAAAGIVTVLAFSGCSLLLISAG